MKLTALVSLSSLAKGARVSENRFLFAVVLERMSTSDGG